MAPTRDRGRHAASTTRAAVAGVVVLLLAVLPNVVRAHPLAPALLELRELGGGRVAVSWKRSLLAIPGVEVAPVLPPGCRTEGAPLSKTEADSVTSTWTIACAASGLVGTRVGFTGLGDAKTDALVRITLADGRLIRGVVRAGEPLLSVPPREDRRAIVRTYTRSGIEHILGGFDHLLFVAGLLLLVRSRRMLIETITAFTVGHSLTLSLAVLDLVRVPPRPTELLIALSVFVLAAELAREPDAPASLLRRRPWAMALVFGLLHGFGFASALGEVGLPEGDVPLALFSFNVGIEIGLLIFVAALLAAVAALRAWRVTWPRWVERAPLYTIGSLAAFWCFERAAALLH
jgi:hydrogenase/urease accessory protein HupE